MLEREAATAYAACFRALGDPTRVQIVSLLAAASRPMTVREITDAMGVGQSTVSYHLKALLGIEVVRVTRTATTSFYQMNEHCVAWFPTATDVVLQRTPPDTAAATMPATGPFAHHTRRPKAPEGP